MNPADNSPLWIRGARVIDPSAKRDEAKGDIFALDGKFVDQLTWIKKMYDEGLFVLKSKDTGETANDAFVNGNCQITSSSIADHGTFGKQAKEGVNWTAAMLPMLEGFERHNSFVGGASLWTLKGKSPEEYKGAAAFYAFLATPEQATWWSTVTGYIPVVNSAFEAMKANGFYDAAHQGALEAAKELKDVEIIYTGPAKATAEAQGLRANVVHVLDRYAADGIIDTAVERNSDLIVMTSHGRRGVTRVLLGSQTAEVLARSTLPVLVIR